MDNPLSRSVLASIFKRHGGITETSNVVEGINDPFLALIRQLLNLEPDEQAAIAMVLSVEHWLFITTRRSLYCHEAEIQEILHCDVVEVDDDDWLMKRMQKRERDRLNIVTKSQRVHLVLQPNRSLWAFESVYSWIVRRCALNRDQDASH